MKKALYIFLALACLSAPVLASDVTIAAQQITQLPFNPSDIGSDQSITVTATNGSATVTSANLFPTSIVGRSGFRVLLGGSQYVVASVASRSSLTLATNFTGSTGSQAMILYKFVFLRVYANRAFQPLGGTEVIQPGGPSTGNFYKEVGVSIINSGSGNVAYIPEFTLPATTDALITNQARYSFVFYRSGGSQLAFYDCGTGKTELQLTPTSPATFVTICNDNASGGIAPASQEAYTKQQIDDILPTCSPGQMDYFLAAGRRKSCLSLDPATLEINSGVLSVIGGGGGGGVSIRDEGSTLGTATALNFVGAGVTATFGAGVGTITIPGGPSGSGTTNYLALWSSSSGLTTATDFYRDGAGPEYVLQDDLHIFTTAASSKLRIDTDQVILEGSGTRATSATMLTMKAIASQTGPFAKFTDSSSTTVFQVDADGDIRPRAVNYTWPAANASGVLTNNGSGTLTWSAAGGSLAGVMQAVNVVLDYSCDPASGTDDTSCLANAMTAAEASTGKTLYLPAGTYETTGLTTSTNSLRIVGDGPGKTILKILSGGGALLTFDNSSTTTHSITIEHISLEGQGGGTANNGLVISGANERFNFTLNNVRFREFGGTPLLSTGGALFTSRFVDLDIDQPSAATGHAIDINGAQTIVFERSYVHNVATNKAAYRFRQGSFVCSVCNGIDSGTSANWGIMGQETALDGTDSYVQLTMMGSNVEDWSATDGIIFRVGSAGSFHSTKFDTLPTGTYRALKFNYLDVGFSGIFDAESSFTLNGSAAWTNGLPVHSYNPPFIQIGSNEIASYYDTNLGSTVAMSWIRNNLNSSAARATTEIARLSLGTSSGQGIDSHALFASNNTYNIGNAAFTASPANIYAASSILMANGATTVGGQNWTITGGASPLYAFDDGTVAGRVQLLTGSHMQLGTTSAHQVLFITSGAGRWRITSAGNLEVDSGTLNVGGVSGNRPANVRASSLLDVGIGGSSAGSVVLRNASNSNSLTLSAGVTSTSYTLTFPLTAPGSTQCLQMSSTGAITATGSGCGGGGGSSVWSDLTDPAANLSLAMAAYTTTFTWGNATGASTNMLTLADTASNSGTGYILSVNTAASSAAKPIRMTAGGTSNGVEMTTAGVLQAIGSGQIQGTATGVSGAIQYNNGSNIMGADNGLLYDSLTATLQLGIASTTSGKLLFRNATNANTATLATGAPAGNVTITLPIVTSTLATLAGTEALTNKSINGMTITSSTGTFTLTNGKTFAVQNTLTFSGTDSSSVAFGAGGTVAYVGTANSWSDGVKQTFNPDGTNSGLNVGGHTADPSSPANGDIFYNSTSNKFRCYENGAWANCIASSSPSLTATFVGYGNGSNLLTGTSDLTYSTSTKTLSVINGSGSANLILNGSSDTSKVNFGAASAPGNQGGILFPFVGGSQSSGPGICWASSASYSTTSCLNLRNGLTFQGANSTHDNFKVAEGTGSSSDGTVRYTFAPSSSLFTQTLATGATNINHDYSIIDLSSTGTAAANFGAGMLVKLENGSSTQVDASRIRTYWTAATAGGETSAVAVGIQKAGGGVADVFTVTGDQYYGIRYTANITGAATIDLNNGNSQELTLTNNVTATTLSNLKAGGIYFIIFKQDGTGSRTLASTNIKAPGGSLTLTATAGARDLFVCTSDGTNLYCNKALDVR